MFEEIQRLLGAGETLAVKVTGFDRRRQMKSSHGVRLKSHTLPDVACVTRQNLFEWFCRRMAITERFYSRECFFSERRDPTPLQTSTIENL